MRTLAIIAAASLLAGGLSAPDSSDSVTTEVSTSSTLTVEELLSDPTVDFLDEGQAVVELHDAGFAVDEVLESGTEVSAELSSTLGDGVAVDTSLTLDLADGVGTLTLTPDSPELAETTLLIEVHELTEDLVDITVTDPATGETERVSSAIGEGAAIPLILGIPLALSALEALILAMTAVVIAGVTYIALDKAIEAIRKKGSNYNHFMAERVNGKPLMIGNGLSFSNAVKRVSGKKDVWSTSKNGAMTVCKSASGGKTPIGPEKDKSGNYKVTHYHTSPRNGAHCFYGAY
ncbi:hypothetical protein ACFWHT_07290 [Microbacterium sp. NPDC058342]|uniref:hypothetical protein n=1 Tax=Microbacterium sp. NPDC058342 TaxID=3346454 RepID=UPI00365729F0